MKFKEHFPEAHHEYFDLVLLMADTMENSNRTINEGVMKSCERKKYGNYLSVVGYGYYKPISKIINFKDE